jgi:hypothetical protein
VNTTLQEHATREVYHTIKNSIHRGDHKAAIRWSVELGPDHSEELWRLLRELASTEISYHDIGTAVLVKTLYENWLLDPMNDTYQRHAITAISKAPKGVAA